ncbi:Scr1 family TA system antitoxin-like transcriptional regulator [Micromonospora sp. DT233]|uniref:Scr1 family TA system antitoxin-like transcriptional regulator n=1 Tax=Micromonospora sp. DT233 TaxID=3393432 RepID=UPI003CEF952C
MYVGLEATASRLRGYDESLIPGLLQTEAYARGVLQHRDDVSEEELEQFISTPSPLPRRLGQLRPGHQDPTLTAHPRAEGPPAGRRPFGASNPVRPWPHRFASRRSERRRLDVHQGPGKAPALGVGSRSLALPASRWHPGLPLPRLRGTATEQNYDAP